MKREVREWELLEYRLFETWWLHRRSDDPRTAITSSLARSIAILIYDEQKAMREFLEIDKKVML